jgi:anaphase-promoting complex subunit 4
LTGLEGGKAVYNIRVSEGDLSRISYIAWSRNYTGKQPAKKGRKKASAWDQLISGDLDIDEKQQDVLNLPHELSFLEIDTVLPKISPLPVSGGSG